MENDSHTRGNESPLALFDAVPGTRKASQHLLLPEARRYKTLHVVLIKPSKYDDEGYVIRFWRGVLPSNTLNVLHGLTLDVARRRLLGDIEIRVDTFDETTQKVPVKKIVGWARQPDTKLVPYVQVGVGAVLTDIHKCEDGYPLTSQALNFTPQGSVGARYMAGKNWSIDMEAMFHHISNAGLGDSNAGINSGGILLGFTYFFGPP